MLIPEDVTMAKGVGSSKDLSCESWLSPRELGGAVLARTTWTLSEKDNSGTIITGKGS